MIIQKRSLYQCYNARCWNENIRCAKGHSLPRMASYYSLMLGKPLELSVCQACPDYDEMGPPVAPEDQGWVKTHLSIPIGQINKKRGRGRPRKKQN